MESIEEILVHRDGISELEAEDIVYAAAEKLNRDCQDVDERIFCEEHFNLEPDYFYQVLELI